METQTKESARQEQQERREQYMNHEITHEQYYTWLGEFIGAGESLLPVSKDRIAKSTDEYLNDIPIKLWDSRHFTVRGRAWAKGLSWSEADTVCVLKTIARNTVNS